MSTNTSVRKAVIPAAGWGTRFLPATKTVPKEMLPIVDTPVIHFAVEEAAAAGITDVILVTSANKRAVEDYFSRVFELEQALERKGDKRLLSHVRSTADIANILTVRQSEQLGLGHAVLMAEAAVGDEPFAVFLPDDVIEASTPAISQLLGVRERYGGSVLAVRQVTSDEISRYGIIEGKKVAQRTYKIRAMVEKPRVEDAPSNLAIVGRYVLTPQIFDLLKALTPGAVGEFQLTDGIAGLTRTQGVHAYEYDGTLLDTGTPIGLLKSSVLRAIARPDMADEFRDWLQRITEQFP